MSVEDRKTVLELVSAAVDGGARQAKACRVLGVDERTVQRWQCLKTAVDGRHGPVTPPRSQLTQAERALVLQIVTSPEFSNKSPHQIVPTLADRGEYVASESSFYRIIKAEKLLAHRGKSAAKTVRPPKAFEATKPREIFSWDITYLLSNVRGRYFYLYLFLDIYSRKIVGWRVYDRESAELSADLLKEICAKEGIDDTKLVVHADNGGPMKGATMLATMQRLGVMPSFSRPSVSNDNPFSESLFKTLKYCPGYPSKPFMSIESAIAWVRTFARWYNEEHLHSAIKFVTPSSRHDGHDRYILAKRDVVYKEAQMKTPIRWSSKTRNWNPIKSVKLNCLKNEGESLTTAFGHKVS